MLHFKIQNIPRNIPPNALTTSLIIFPSSFRLSPSSLIAVTTNSYTLPCSNWTSNSLGGIFVTVFNLIHSSGLSSTTILWYTVYWVITFPLFCGSLHFKITILSVTSFGRSSIVAAAGTPLKPNLFDQPSLSSYEFKWFSFFAKYLPDMSLWSPTKGFGAYLLENGRFVHSYNSKLMKFWLLRELAITWSHNKSRFQNSWSIEVILLFAREFSSGFSASKKH